MNNDIAFGVAKYLEKKTGVKRLDQAFSSSELLKEKITYSLTTLEKKLVERPTIQDLKNRNIFKNNSTANFDYLHSVLETIHFKENVPKVSPSIAGVVKKLDFQLKRNMFVRNINLEKEPK